VCFLCGTNGISRTFLLLGLKYDNEILNRLDQQEKQLRTGLRINITASGEVYQVTDMASFL
jgi:hypothetical protein